ncbi:hypothetical protein Daus18300_005174 [Diaporthe australafricana]|uniref:Uncharacterized protein n=1 Tax=Diaporthe australafricana TaxID=127596 RepID=A0ABR3X3H8_9PEZI
MASRMMADKSPTKPFFKIVCRVLVCRLGASLSSKTSDGPRKRYVKEWRIYQQYMGDQEQKEQQNQDLSSSPSPSSPLASATEATRSMGCLSKIGKCTEHARELASISNIRLKFRRRKYRVKKGSPPPKPPPYCPHWHKPRHKPTKARGTERLRVRTEGYMSRLEKYEASLRQSELKKARSDLCSHTAELHSLATTSSAQTPDLEAELQSLSKQLQELEIRNEQLVRALSASRAAAKQTRVEKPRHAQSLIKQASSGARSIGTAALKEKDATRKFEESQIQSKVTATCLSKDIRQAATGRPAAEFANQDADWGRTTVIEHPGQSDLYLMLTGRHIRWSRMNGTDQLKKRRAAWCGSGRTLGRRG